MSTKEICRVLVGLLSLAAFVAVASCSENGPNGPIDITPPLGITDLRVDSIDGGTAYLSWTAPGDDGAIGTATTYDLRYATDSATINDWTSSTAAENVPAPQPSGSSESFELSGLTPNTVYYFAIKSSDEVGNTSDTSNIAVLRPLSLILPNLQMVDCSTAAVPMTVERFSEVAGFEIHVQYESQHATYDSITSTYISNATINESAEIINFVWADIGNLVTVPNGDTLLTIHFSDLTDSCQLAFKENTEVVNIEGDPFVVDLEDGSIECVEP